LRFRRRKQRIYIRESNLSNAWNGDRVLVKLTKEGSRRRSPEGEVELILERSIKATRASQADLIGFRAVPLDDRLLFEIDLRRMEPTWQRQTITLSMWKFCATRWDNLPHWSGGADPRQRCRNRLRRRPCLLQARPPVLSSVLEAAAGQSTQQNGSEAEAGFAIAADSDARS